jgi:MoxR-like ATPase
MAQRHLDRTVRFKAKTFKLRLLEIKDGLVGRGEVVDLVALAALCREHALLVGPPGTAKTMLLDRFRRAIDARYFSYLLTRFTEPAELFGPLDVRSFQEERRYRINTDGMLPEAELAFLDEIFLGSSAILNSLLTLINERRFNNGSEILDSPLVTLLGSCNEIPGDPVLGAFSDRFLLRCQIDYVEDDAIEDVLEHGWKAESEKLRQVTAAATDPAWRPTPDPGAPPPFPLADLLLLQRALPEIDLSAVRQVYTRILRAFRAEGVAFSDRRAVKAQKTFAASALLAGRESATVDDLAPLVYLWTELDDEATIRRIVADHEVPVQDLGHQPRDLSELDYEYRQLVRQSDQLNTDEQYREIVRRLSRLLIEVRRDHPDARDLISAIEQLRDRLVEAWRERHGGWEMDGRV